MDQYETHIPKTEKRTIKQRFGKNFTTYDKEASVQQTIAERLASLLSNTEGVKSEKILEIGCGTGFLTEKLTQHFQIKEYILNDIAESSFSAVQNRVGDSIENMRFVAGDAENVSFPEELNTIVSASCFQWFTDLDIFLAKAHKLLLSGGTLAFSTFGENNYSEIRKSLGIGLPYLSLEKIKTLLSSHFNILWSEEWQEQLFFDTPTDVLRHMKRTGVNSVCNEYFGKEKLLHFKKTYQENFEENGKVGLTYHPVIFIVRSKDIVKNSAATQSKHKLETILR